MAANAGSWRSIKKHLIWSCGNVETHGPPLRPRARIIDFLNRPESLRKEGPFLGSLCIQHPSQIEGIPCLGLWLESMPERAQKIKPAANSRSHAKTNCTQWLTTMAGMLSLEPRYRMLTRTNLLSDSPKACHLKQEGAGVLNTHPTMASNSSRWSLAAHVGTGFFPRRAILATIAPPPKLNWPEQRVCS
eukprot:4080197-Amphidinium_carterae.2